MKATEKQVLIVCTGKEIPRGLSEVPAGDPGCWVHARSRLQRGAVSVHAEAVRTCAQVHFGRHRKRHKGSPGYVCKGVRFVTLFGKGRADGNEMTTLLFIPVESRSHFAFSEFGRKLLMTADCFLSAELSVGMTTEGIDVRSVGNTLTLHETALIEAFNLKAAVEYQLKNCEYEPRQSF